MTESTTLTTELLVLGGGPGGYAAAFYAADLGKQVVIVELEEQLGGVCLHRGCIPSKALLHATHLLHQAEHANEFGIQFQKPTIDLDKLRSWKQNTIQTLAKGIDSLASARKVTVVKGRGYLEDSRTLRVESTEGQRFIQFQQAILAVGSQATLPSAFDLGNPRVMTSRAALLLEDIPDRLLVIGGGYIGMELGSVYARLGSQVSLVENQDRLLLGVDPDLTTPVVRLAKEAFNEINLGAKVEKLATRGSEIEAQIQLASNQSVTQSFDRVLVSVGRSPRTQNIGLENTKIGLDPKGFIQVDERLVTAESHIAAIGDCIGGAMLAHKAHYEARDAVEALVQSEEPTLTPHIPAVVFTDPEIAWCGLTETAAKEAGRKHQVAKFPWAASGRAISVGQQHGFTKLIFDPDTQQLLGAGIVGNGAGELIGEAILALEMGATAYDLAKTVHPHPTLTETLMEAADVFYGHATHFRSSR